MDCNNSNFASLKCIKIEHNSNTDGNYCDKKYFIEDKKNENYVPINGIKCKNNKSFDIVDKWIARIIVKVPTGNNWHNIIDREISLLKVRYPFLTEQQLRGKALKKFGIPSTCGNIVRIGAGKLTGVIANDLFQKKKKKIPAAFKVLKKFLPCVNKLEVKPEINMWTEQNQLITNSYNKDMTTLMGALIEPKITIEPELMKTNNWESSKMQKFVKNPMNKLVNLSSNNKIVNNSHEQICCSELTPKKEQSHIPRRKALISKFNDTGVTIFDESNKIESLENKIKCDVTSPGDRQYLRIIANSYTGNISDYAERATFNDEQLQKNELNLQMSPDSKYVLWQLHNLSKTQKSLKDIDKDNVNQIKGHDTVEEFTTVDDDMEINSDATQQLFFEPYIKNNQNHTTNYTHETSLQYMATYFPSHSKADNSSRKIKRYHNDLISIISSSSKIPRNNSDQHFQRNISDNRIHEFFDSQTVSNYSIDKSTRLEVQYSNISKLSVNSLPISVSFEENLNIIEDYNSINHSKLSTLQRSTKPFYIKTLLTQEIQFPVLSSSQNCNILNDLWTRRIKNRQDFSCNNLSVTQYSKTTCTLTPDVDEILTEINNASLPSSVEEVSTQMSVDLLNRENVSQIYHPNIDSTLNSNIQPQCTNDNSQLHMKINEQKAFMLSNFCSEFDLYELKSSIHGSLSCMTNVEMLSRSKENITMSIIKIGIAKVIKILDKDCSNSNDQ